MKRIALYIILSFILVVSMSSESRCVTMKDYEGNPATMSAYNSIPPFLTVAVEPNLLLLIDNSASMYDLAYIDDQSQCYDESYVSSTTYAGYFEPATYYKYDYDETNGQFEPFTTDQTVAKTFITDATGTPYANTDVGVTINEVADPVDPTIVTKVVTAFAAKGNFLNWATASKLDIEKEILTGGKYDSGRLVMESRGCLDRRFVKQVAVMDATFTTTFHLTLGIRPPDDTEKAADASDDTTRIEIFAVTTDGFLNGPCESAIAAFDTADPDSTSAQGQIKDDIAECMGYSPSERGVADSMGAMNHSTHNCWFRNEHNRWPEGNGSVQSIKSDCANVYETMHNDDPDAVPADITTDDMAYVCSGVYDDDPATAPNPNPDGFVGSCWDPNIVTWKANGNIDTPGWIAGADAENGCIDLALQAYCGQLKVPEVVDPTDQADATSEYWNLPAVLIDSGVVGQLDEPLAVLKGYIQQSTAPTGIIQKFADDLRLGSMTFNYDGSDSECNEPDAHVLYACKDSANRDGGKITAYIDKSAAHTVAVVAAINDIKATSWTPIAEAMYSAIGYYTHQNALRLATDDWDINEPDPVTVWCQSNNILIITDGASTADQAQAVLNFAASDGDADPDPTLADSPCSTLSGSTRFDDLTYYAKHAEASDIFSTPQIDNHDKENITTHIVVAGTPRDTGTTDECNPKILLEHAASNADTPLYIAENPSELEDAIENALWAIVGASGSGTAASVVSAARKGEGAIYQAIFYRTLEDISGTEINWVGQLHGLFVDEYGNMREDSDGNDTLSLTNDSIVELFFDPSGTCTKARRETDSDGDGVPDGSPETISLSQVNYMWEAGKALAGRSADTRTIYTSIDGVRKDFTLANAATLRPYLAQDTLENAKRLINYIRGKDYVKKAEDVKSTDHVLDADVDPPYRSRTFPVDGADRVWKLGDIVYSTPTAVGKPMERYDLIYHDRSYRTFKMQKHNRRNVVYVGANDGMLHAFNAGYYDEAAHQFTSEGAKPLGMELWAYIPYNLLPHLQWLKDPNYSHTYYVDLKPKVVDAQIFSDATHPGGWGTVLICGMRLGGGEITVNDAAFGGDKTFRSAYFAFDITNPDAPEFMWEFTHADLGFTTSYPAIVAIDRSYSPDKWYIAFGSGPTDYDGTSTQAARTYAVDLRTGGLLGYITTSDGGAYMGDPISVDVDIPESQCTTDCTYKPDVAYIGNSEGKFYRILRTNTSPYISKSTFLDLGSTKPIISEANASQDDDGRLWIYFGTGKFISDADKTSTEIQSLVGVKEPYDWDDCDNNADTDLTIACGSPVNPSDGNLLDVTNYKVYEGGHVYAYPAHTPAINTFEDLVNQIKQYDTETPPRPYDGWRLDLPAGERCMTEPTVLGGIVTFTTFRPDSHVCSFEGESFVYPVFYKTGTAPYLSVIGYGDSTWTDGDGQTHNEISRRLSIGQGVAATPSLHVGGEEGAKAFIQCSTGEIRIIHEMNLMEGYRSRPLYWIQPGD